MARCGGVDGGQRSGGIIGGINVMVERSSQFLSFGGMLCCMCASYAKESDVKCRQFVVRAYWTLHFQTASGLAVHLTYPPWSLLIIWLAHNPTFVRFDQLGHMKERGDLGGDGRWYVCSGISVSIVGVYVVSQHGVFVNRITNGHSSTFSAFMRGWCGWKATNTLWTASVTRMVSNISMTVGLRKENKNEEGTVYIAHFEGVLKCTIC